MLREAEAERKVKRAHTTPFDVATANILMIQYEFKKKMDMLTLIIAVEKITCEIS